MRATSSFGYPFRDGREGLKEVEKVRNSDQREVTPSSARLPMKLPTGQPMTPPSPPMRSSPPSSPLALPDLPPKGDIVDWAKLTEGDLDQPVGRLA